MSIYKVYKITNRLNGKIYIGQTRQTIEKRFMQHLHTDSPLGQAMRQCGADNFTIEVIEECENQEQLNERERFWIKVLNCKVPNGYNLSDGGRAVMKIPTYKQQISIRVDPYLYEKFKVVADKNSRTISNQVEFLMKQCVEKYESDNGKISVVQNHNVFAKTEIKM